MSHRQSPRTEKSMNLTNNEPSIMSSSFKPARNNMSMSTQDENFMRMDSMTGLHSKRGSKNEMNPHYDYRMSRNDHRRMPNHGHNP